MEQQAYAAQTVVSIAIVEDDIEQFEYLRLCLGADYFLSGYPNATTFVRSLARAVPDILLLDWHLPDITGIELLKQLRRQGHNMLIIVITARNDEGSLVTAFEAGANDFIAKLVRVGELKARIRALTLRAGLSVENSHYQVGDYRIDVQLRHFFLNEQQVRLTNREFDLAVMLFQRLGELLHREVLLRSVWGVEDAVGTRTLDTHMSRLRKKLALNGEYGLQLRSAYQLGYRLEKTA
ncbi:MAG: response regulator transcription factor [Oceanospirillales bacterium]|nr:response regulator transcription factor [Oceanospirillales bacterium]